MMLKIIDWGSQDLGEAPMQQVKLSSRGLLGSDRSQFIKRASAKLAHDLDSLRSQLHDDEPLIHQLIVGATEDYGSNRNGDGFKRATCERTHPTFVKYGRFYRNHKNKDPSKSYGLIKSSEFNDRMKRIELLVALNGSEKAAQRNGGLVATEELQKLATDKEIQTSMACKVSHDVCSYCGNKAPTAEDYCHGADTGGHCKAGGLRDNMGALVEIDGGVHQLHADNPDPVFFDDSHVYRGADRIAVVSGLVKAANCRPLSGAALARTLGLTVPPILAINGSQPPRVQEMLKLAYQLSDLEQIPPRVGWLQAFAREVRSALEPPPLFREKFALALRALADAEIVLPLCEFVALTADYPLEKAAEVAEIVKPELSGVYTRLLADVNLADRLMASKYAAATARATPLFASWAAKQAGQYSLQEAHMLRRLSLAAIRGVPFHALPAAGEKQASAPSPTSRLAEEYATYTLAFLAAVPVSDRPRLAELVVLQNLS